nr:hypothetical protein [Streptomyces sp. SID14446]
MGGGILELPKNDQKSGVSVTARDTTTDSNLGPVVRLRVEGEVDAQTIAYVRTKVNAVLDRPGLPATDGEMRISKAAAHHVEQPWSAGLEIRVGGDMLVVHACEASAHELADRLQDRLRRHLDRLTHRADTARKSAAPPPWRGGPADV